MELLFQSDWFAYPTCFFNTRTGKFGTLIHEVIDLGNLEIDPQGLSDYLDFGYCVFGHTPVRDVKFLMPSQRLCRRDDGTLEVQDTEDEAASAVQSVRLSEDDIWDRIKESVRAWEASCQGEIVIPTSGGYDSRILNWMVGDKGRIRSFTYGITTPQSASSEVVYAKELSRRLGTAWQQVELGDFFNYFDDWYQLFGVSTHAHGMYQIEFYKKIRRLLPEGEGRTLPLLSGYWGDVWAGRSFPEPFSADDLWEIGLTHGLCADPGRCRVREPSEARITYWERHREKLRDPRLRVFESLHYKQILISYLLRVPESLGYAPYAPFADLTTAAAMVNLPPERRRNRVWQQEFFRKNHIMTEDGVKAQRLPNTLDTQALDRMPLRPLDRTILAEAVSPGYVDWVNRYVPQTPWNRAQGMLLSIRGAGRFCQLFTGRIPTSVRTRAYMAYLCLYPIERLLRARDGMGVKSAQ